MGFVLKAGAGLGTTVSDYGTEYTGIAQFTGKFGIENSNTAGGIASSALGTSGTHTWYVGAARTLAMTITTSGLVDTAKTLRVTGQADPGSGSGVEILYTGANGIIQAYNRTGAAFLPLTISALSLTLTSTNLGFYGAGGVTKPNVTGSRGGNAALTSLCTALANLGLITNSTT